MTTGRVERGKIPTVAYSYGMKKKFLMLFLLGTGLLGCAESDNANLKSLRVSSGTLVPEFSISENKYELTVNAATVQITPTTQDPNANLLIKEGDTPYGLIPSGQAEVVELEMGINRIRFQVVAENGYDFRDYLLVITR